MYKQTKITREIVKTILKTMYDNHNMIIIYMEKLQHEEIRTKNLLKYIYVNIIVGLLSALDLIPPCAASRKYES